MPQVEVSGNGRGRGIHGIYRTVDIKLKTVNAIIFPEFLPLLFYVSAIITLGNRTHIAPLMMKNKDF
jgi:hypothetical protein